MTLVADRAQFYYVDDLAATSRRIAISLIMTPTYCSYAREWQAKLRELQESKLSKNASPRRSPSKDNGVLPLPLGLQPHGPPPIVSITPSKKSSPLHHKKDNIKMDSNGALNLASSPSPPLTSSTSAAADSPSRRSPQPLASVSRPQVNYGVEACVVCGDRASGKFLISSAGCFSRGCSCRPIRPIYKSNI